MGVHNLVVEAKETTAWQAHSKIRKISPGLTLADYRVMQDDIAGIAASTPRKKLMLARGIKLAAQYLLNRLSNL